MSESLKGMGTSGSPQPELQAILYQLVRELRPKTTLEIGTLFAGTTHVIARALWANGEGRVTTIDPFGGERVRPGGVDVLDNSEVWGVAYATADFLERNSDWRLAGHEPGDHANLREISRNPKGNGPLGMLVLFAPPYVRIGKFPLEGSVGGLNAGPYERLRLELHREAPAGEVEFSFYFITWDIDFHRNGLITAASNRNGKTELSDGASAIEILFDSVRLDASPQESNIELQYELRFLARDGVSGLALAVAPVLF